jgi:hypothetical protein
MGLFSKILDKLGIKKAETPAPAPSMGKVTGKPTVTTSIGQPVAKPAAMEMVDVVAKLDAMAKANPEKLNWKVSIVDLLKLLGLDSSLAALKELAVELGCPSEFIGGNYAKMNMWLHKTVLQKIAENGGNIPAALLK